MRIVAAVLALLPLFLPLAFAQSEPAPACPEKTACETLRPLAQSGNAESQFLLGMAYLNGRYYGGARSESEKAEIAEGMKWWRKAAEQGNPSAIQALRALDLQSPGSSEEQRKLLEFWRALAEKENPIAQEFIGTSYSHGDFGLKRDPTAAVLWWKKAAEQGNFEAQRSLFTAYCRGSGVKRDPAEADKWFSAAYMNPAVRGDQRIGSMRTAFRSGCTIQIAE